MCLNVGLAHALPVLLWGMARGRSAPGQLEAPLVPWQARLEMQDDLLFH
jgi:hypothetical protein